MNPMQQQSPQNVIYQQYTSPPNAATSAQNQHQQQMLNSGMQQQRVVYAVNPPQQSPVRTVVGGSTVGAPTPVAPMQPRSIQPNTRQDTAGGSGDASTGVGAGRLTDKATLDAIVRDLDPHIQMDDDIKELLLDMADDFIEQVSAYVCASKRMHS
jgi:transcription initiation factor TFIID subunit TAF12